MGVVSRWLSRLAQLRSGVPLPETETPPARSICSIVQNSGGLGDFELLNNMNNVTGIGKFDAADLCYFYNERAGICEDIGQDRAQAEARAWNQVALQWHRQQRTAISADLCAGCGQPLDGAPDVVIFPHGERAHANDGFDCIRRYIERWKREAATALLEMGIPMPVERGCGAPQMTEQH